MRRTPDLYYFSGEIECDGIQFNVSEKLWFEHLQLQQLSSYPFFSTISFTMSETDESIVE